MFEPSQETKGNSSGASRRSDEHLLDDIPVELEPDDEIEEIKSTLEAYYGSLPTNTTEIEVLNGFVFSFSLKDAGPKLNIYLNNDPNTVHVPLSRDEIAKHNIDNVKTHCTLLSKLETYQRQLEGANYYRVIAFFRSCVLKDPALKKTRIEELKKILMKDLPDNYSANKHNSLKFVSIINRNINTFQNALTSEDQKLFNTRRESEALAYSKKAASLLSCGRYQPRHNGEELMNDLTKLVRPHFSRGR